MEILKDYLEEGITMETFVDDIVDQRLDSYFYDGKVLKVSNGDSSVLITAVGEIYLVDKATQDVVIRGYRNDKDNIITTDKELDDALVAGFEFEFNNWFEIIPFDNESGERITFKGRTFEEIRYKLDEAVMEAVDILKAIKEEPENFNIIRNKIS